MTEYNLKSSIQLLALSLLLSLAAVFARADEPELLLDDGVAANGYDVIAYFSGKVKRGIPEFAVEYRGAQWYFENSENAARFKASPEKFEPVYGGYCAYGVSQGYLVKTDPHAWSVVQGRLYLNYNAPTRNEWLSDRDNYIALAEKIWPKLIS